MPMLLLGGVVGEYVISPFSLLKLDTHSLNSGRYAYIQGGFFNWSAQKMTKSQSLKEFSEVVLPKND